LPCGCSPLHGPLAGGGISTAPDSGPCKGEQPQGNVAGSFYCAPLLVSATAAIKP